MNRDKTTDTNQASEDELREAIEKLLRFNCPDGCDGNGSYPEMSADGEWEQGQCQWCFEYGMPARQAIQALIRTEKLKLLDEVIHQSTINLRSGAVAGWAEIRKEQLEAEL